MAEEKFAFLPACQHCGADQSPNRKAMNQEIHIGELIVKRLKKQGMSKAEFARRINISRQNVSNILSKKDLYTALLRIISEVQEYDLFSELSTSTREGLQRVELTFSEVRVYGLVKVEQ